MKIAPFVMMRQSASIGILDAKTHAMNRVDLKLMNGIKPYEVLQVLALKDKIFAFYTTLEKSEMTLWAIEIAPTNLMPKGKSQQLTKVNCIGIFARLGSTRFDFATSRDHSKLVIIKKDDSIEVLAYNQDLQQLWKKEWPRAIEQGHFFGHAGELDNDGNFFIAGEWTTSKFPSLGDGPKQWVLWSLPDNGLHETFLPLTLDDREISQVLIRKLDKELICAGLFSQGSHRTEASGTFVMKINTETNSVESTKQTQFDQAFIDSTRLITRRSGASFETNNSSTFSGLKNYRLQHLNVGPSNEIYLIGEYQTADIGYSYSHYDFGAILIAKLTLEGQLEWVRTLNKMQTADKRYSSYLLAYVKNKMCFLFNDSPKNTEVSSRTVRQFNGFASALTMISVDDNGNCERQLITDKTGKEGMIIPKFGRQLSDGTVLLYAKNRTKSELGILRLN
ncbi:MAG TPA: hypothetical protein DGG95_05545 [Cytophagales bacterium]|nr:hypothetical protein [Cytophagales bacterium]